MRAKDLRGFGPVGTNGPKVTDPTPSQFIVYRLRQMAQGGPLAYDAIAAEEAADHIATLQRELAEARARATKWYDRYQQQNDNWVAAEAALADARRDAERNSAIAEAYAAAEEVVADHHITSVSYSICEGQTVRLVRVVGEE